MITMSRALPQHHPYRGPLQAQQQKIQHKQQPEQAGQQQQQKQQQQQHQQQQQQTRHQRPQNMSSAFSSTLISPQSPLAFTLDIPISEIRLSKETLGSGSFGTVYKGKWRHRNVAVKKFKTREEMDSFLVEVKQLSLVEHPNIVKLYGSTRLPNTAYLVMEYAESGSLNHLLHENKGQGYDLRHACNWAVQTARGVAYLHGFKPKAIMHRDLKPANLLLFSRGRILKICDFGTACDVKTQMTSNTGSPSYMAPEVFSSISYHESGDVYSWAIIFWEILVREHPYDQSYSNPWRILWSVHQGKRPNEIEDCPKPIWDLITRSWDMDPTKRPSMIEIAREMEFICSLISVKSDKGAADSRHQQQQNSGATRYRQLSDKLGTTAPGSASPQPHTSEQSPSKLPSPSIKSLSELSLKSSSPVEHMIDGREHNFSVHTASTSSQHQNQQNHNHNHQPMSEHYQQYQHHHHQYHNQQHHHQQISRHYEHSINTQSITDNRKRALQHKIDLLKEEYLKLEVEYDKLRKRRKDDEDEKERDANKCDIKKKITDELLVEFEKLKVQVKTKRRDLAQPQLGKQMGTPLTPTSPEQQMIQFKQQQQQQQQQPQQQQQQQQQSPDTDIGGTDVKQIKGVIFL